MKIEMAIDDLISELARLKGLLEGRGIITWSKSDDGLIIVKAQWEIDGQTLEFIRRFSFSEILYTKFGLADLFIYNANRSFREAMEAKK